MPRVLPHMGRSFLSEISICPTSFMWYSWGEVSRVISFFMRSSCFFSLPTSTHVGSAAALRGAGAVSASSAAAAFTTVSPAAVLPASAAFARNVPMPASGITPSSITSVRSRHMALCVILLMLFLLLFGFLFLFRPRQLFAADVALVRVRSCHRTAFRAHRVPQKVLFPIGGNVFQRVQSNSAEK